MQNSKHPSFNHCVEMKFSYVATDVKPHLALIYMWEIHDENKKLIGRYVGKAKNGASRPLKHYKRNVSRLLKGKPYRKSNPNGFRKIHRALADATQMKGTSITLYLLENISCSSKIDDRERYWIDKKNTLGNESWQLNGI